MLISTYRLQLFRCLNGVYDSQDKKKRWSYREFFKSSLLVMKTYFPKLDKISCDRRLTQWQLLKVKLYSRTRFINLGFWTNCQAQAPNP